MSFNKSYYCESQKSEGLLKGFMVQNPAQTQINFVQCSSKLLISFKIIKQTINKK